MWPPSVLEAVTGVEIFFRETVGLLPRFERVERFGVFVNGVALAVGVRDLPDCEISVRS